MLGTRTPSPSETYETKGLRVSTPGRALMGDYTNSGYAPKISAEVSFNQSPLGRE